MYFQLIKSTLIFIARNNLVELLVAVQQLGVDDILLMVADMAELLVIRVHSKH